MDELKEKIAIAVRRAQSDLDGDMFGYQRIMFDVAAGAALRAIEEAGFVIVPKKPTEAMRHAGYRIEDRSDDGVCAVDFWNAMIAARPLNLEEPRG